MQKNELDFYEEVGNWDFSEIKYRTEELTDWNFYQKIRENTNEKSLCLDLGCGGGEKVLAYYPKVGMVIATDFSKEMIKTARENAKNFSNNNVKFAFMDNLDLKFPSELFDLVSARHTVIDSKAIYDCLVPGGKLVIEEIDKKDCIEMKDLFGRGQAYEDEISIAEKDYQDLKKAGFSKVEKLEIKQNEYYETEQDLMALLLKTPILSDFSEVGENDDLKHEPIEKDLFEEYVRKYKTEKGILLKRVLYGIVAEK